MLMMTAAVIAIERLDSTPLFVFLLTDGEMTMTDNVAVRRTTPVVVGVGSHSKRAQNTRHV
jgi:hypothetical protein